MPLHYNNGGSWVSSTWHGNDGGSWTNGRIHLKVSGSWVVVSGRIVDGFEDGDINEYVANGHKGLFRISSTSFEGSNSIERYDEVGQRFILSDQGDGLEYYPQPGDTFECAVLGHTSHGDSADSQIGPIWGWDGSGGTSSDPQPDGGYTCHHNFSDGSTVLQRIEDQPSGYDPTNLDTSINNDTNYSGNEWRLFTVDWGTNGDMTVEYKMPDGTVLATLSANDSTYTSRGVGVNTYRGGSGAGSQLDNYHIAQ